MKRFIQELFVGTLGSAISFGLIAEFHWIFLSSLGGGDRDSVFAGVFIGLPLGSILGLYILRKGLFKEKKAFTLLNLLGGIVFSFFVGILGIISLDFSKYPFFVLPVFISAGFMTFRKRSSVTKV